MDEVRYYSVALSEDHVQAEASPVLGGIEPSFIQVGCLECFVRKRRMRVMKTKGIDYARVLNYTLRGIRLPEHSG